MLEDCLWGHEGQPANAHLKVTHKLTEPTEPPPPELLHGQRAKVHGASKVQHNSQPKGNGKRKWKCVSGQRQSKGTFVIGQVNLKRAKCSGSVLKRATQYICISVLHVLLQLHNISDVFVVHQHISDAAALHQAQRTHQGTHQVRIICDCVHACMHVRVQVYGCACMHVRVHVSLCVDVHACACTVCGCACMCMCMCVCTCVMLFC